MTPTVGALLRQWRKTRKLTQLQLAERAEVSTRHLSYVENGRSRPSAEMLLVLGSVLELPLRERNALLLAAGHAPAYRETDLNAPEMAPIRQTLALLLQQAEPYGAVVVDGAWNLCMANPPATRFIQTFAADPARLLMMGPPNLLRLLLHPTGIRPYCVNWESVACAMVARAHREHAVTADRALARVLAEVMDYEGIPNDWARLELEGTADLLLPMHVKRGDYDLRLYTTITTLGTAQDITLQELRIESLFPADEESKRQLLDLNPA